MSRPVWAWGRIVGSALVLAVLVWRLGTGPFLDGLRSIDDRALVAAAGIVVLTTVCSAWRWTIVARGLGVKLSLAAAVAAYYRSLFLNLTLPGGIVGDVHRGVSHGREVSDVGRALRAVAWERFAGQVVQALLTVVILLALPSPVQSSMPPVAIAVVVAVLGVVLVARMHRADAWPAWTRVRRTAAGDIRDGLIARRAWLGIALASALIVAGHTVNFLIAARTAGATAPLSQMLPMALLVMLAMVLPNIGGWGPREGVAAWAFGAAGLGAQRGVATAVVYGVMVLVASLPGAAVLLVAWVRRTRPPERNHPPLQGNSTCLTGPTSCRAVACRSRTARGLPPSPITVTVTERVKLDPCADFFTMGEIEKLVYCTSPRVVDARSRLGTVATVVDAGRRMRMRCLSEDLGERGVQRLMVEGGGNAHPWPARGTCRGPPDRRRGPVALRALPALPDRLTQNVVAARTAPSQDPHPTVDADAVLRRVFNVGAPELCLEPAG